ncbi:MAG: phenylalanine--tRNA ligase subunit beta [Ruminococcaceae bacterium]|nr:phenylalanine--tRNA ligase subunit beta [Oscillospiraceae bacterium]
MLISMNWISDFVDLSGLNIEELIHRFTLSTAEVEEIIHKGEDLSGVVAGRILTIENHPKSKKLHLLTVDGGDKIYDVVCGAPNVREGMIVPFAKEGGRAGGMDIRKATIAGYDSYGMCCSEAELGISADHSGLMELPEDTVVGTDIKKLFPIDDIVFEVDNKSLTNRPDLWGHYGIAREFAALSGRKLRPLTLHDTDAYANLPEVSIDIRDTEHCYRYSSIKVENVTIGVSPVQMRIRLFYCGMRAINLLADLTNYLMLEMGQPMHAFDLRKVDKIEVARFPEPFDFETLDQTTRRIDEDTLMICSSGTPVAVAGIMGGYDSEIADDTTSLLIESANFDGVSVRKSSSRLGLRTDSSMRYEKMLDPEMTVPAIKRYLALLLDICPDAKAISRLTDSYVHRYKSITLDFDKKYVDRYTGIKITNARIVKTLESLGFTVRHERGNFSVDVPSWRATKDVTIKADIIEEITRIYGYDNFEIKTTVSPLFPVRSSQGRVDDTQVKDILCDRFGLHEVHSYIWSDAKKLKEIGIAVEDNTRLVNSINPDQVVLRRSMIPTLLSFAADNRGFAEEFGIFEIGRVSDGLKSDGKCNERKRLGIVLVSRSRSEKQLYLYLKDLLLELTGAIRGCSCTLAHCEATDHDWMHPVNSCDVYLGGKEIGSMYALAPSVAAAFDKKAVAVCAEIDMYTLAEIAPSGGSFTEPSRFPGVDIDLSLLLDEKRLYGEIAEIIEQNRSELLTGYTVIDVYENEQLQGKRVVTVRLFFASPERTLSGEEVSLAAAELLGCLEAKGIMLKK